MHSKRIAVLVDGESEQALGYLNQALAKETGNTFIKPVVMGVNGMSRPERIAAACLNRVQIIESRVGNLDKILVLLDREANSMCPGLLHEIVENAINLKMERLGGRDVSVVIKNVKFENWLIADVRALRGLVGRFQLSKGQLQAIAPNRADTVADAEALLKAAAKRPGYHKTRDAAEIMKRADAMRIAANSRSFRRYLRCVSYPAYKDQSRDP